MADEKVLIEIDVENADALKALEAQNAEIQELEDSQKSLRESGKKNTAQYQKQAQELSRLKSERKQNLKIMDSEQGSAGRLSAKLGKLKQDYKKLNKSTEEGASKAKVMEKEMKSLSDQLSEGEEASGNFSRNVGNYPKMMSAAASGTGILAGAFEALNLVMSMNPIGLVVTAVGALIAGFTYLFKQTTVGTAVFESAFNVINAIIIVAVDYVDKLANNVKAAFEDPEQALKDFAGMIKQYVADKIEAATRIVTLLGSTVKKAFSGDFKGAMEDAANASLTLATEFTFVGMTAKAMGEAVSDVNDKLQKNYELLNFITEETKRLRKARADQSVVSAKLSKAEEELAQKAEDSTLSLKEQIHFTKEAQKVRDKRYKQEKKLVDDEIKLAEAKLKKEKEGTDAYKDLYDELNEKKKEAVELDAEYALQEQQTATILRQHKSDQNELYLDELEKSFQRQRTLFQEIAEDENLSIETRKDALKELDQEYENFYKNTQSYFEQYGITAEQFDELLGLEGDELARKLTSSYAGLSEAQAKQLAVQVQALKEDGIERIRIQTTLENATIDSQNRIFQNEIEKQKEAAARLLSINLSKIASFKASESIRLREINRSLDLVEDNYEKEVELEKRKFREVLLLEELRQQEVKYTRKNAYKQARLDLASNFKDELSEISKQENLEKGVKKEAYEQGRIDKETYEKGITDIESKFSDKRLEAFIDKAEGEMKLKKNYDREEEAQKQINADNEVQIEHDKNMRLKALDEERMAQVKAMAMAQLTAYQGLFNSMLTLASAFNEANTANEEMRAKKEKNYAIASALINGAVGITRQFAENPMPLAIINSAAIAATTAAQIAGINSAYNNRTSGSSGSASSSINSPIAGNTVNTSSVDAQGNLEAIQEAISDMGLTVSVSEINAAQQSVQTSQNNSSI